jgi:hypothetical protein
MSTYANSAKAHVWEDGDAFRAPKGTGLPEDIFAAVLVSGTGAGSVTWEAFGGIRAGFVVGQKQDRKAFDVWNNESGADYKRAKGTTTASIKLEPVDNSKATVLTLLRGGSVAETLLDSGVFEHIAGDGEEFALIVRVYDGDEKKAYYVERGELDDIPDETMDGKDVEGYDLVVVPLAPAGGGKAIRKFTTINPLAP